MKKILYFIIYLCLLPILFVGAEIVPLTILHTNDFHSYLLPHQDGKGGAAIIAGYYKQARKDIDNLLILDAGDMISGTPVSSLFKGDPIFHVLNHWTLDAATIGNHEFDNGWQRIERYRDIADFPLLCANAYYPDPKGMMHLIGDHAYKVFDRGGLKVAVIGVVTEYTPYITVREGTEGIKFVGSIDALNQLVPKLKKTVDIIIVLSHIGHDNDRRLAEEVEDIHLVIGGHSHTRLDKEVYINGVPIVQAGSKGRYIGRIDLKADNEADHIVDFTYQLLEVDPTLAKPDAETKKLIQQWEDRVSEVVDRPLGTAVKKLSKIDMIFLADAAFLEATDADYSFHNSGGTRGSLNQGEFSYREMWNIYPFDNTLVTARVIGKEIPEHFYGYQPIQPEKMYKVVTNSYIRDQWKRMHPDLAEWEWQDTGLVIRDAIIRYIEKRKNIEPVKLFR